MARLDECQPAALAPTDHGLDDVAEKPACRSAVSQFAAPLKVLPGDLEQILEELGERDGHEQKTNENRARSMSSPLRRPLSYFDRNRLGPKDDIAEHVGLRRVQGIADREARIPPIASEGVVHGCDLPSLLLGVRCDDGDLAAGPAKVVVRSRRQAKQRPRLADFDGPFGNDLQLFVFRGHQSAVLSRRMVNSMAPSGSSRHCSTSLM